MKLSTDTLSVFKNFSTINEGIFVKRGNVIETCLLYTSDAADE